MPRSGVSAARIYKAPASHARHRPCASQHHGLRRQSVASTALVARPQTNPEITELAHNPIRPIRPIRPLIQRAKIQTRHQKIDRRPKPLAPSPSRFSGGD
jgi:hypothetical protein